MFYADIILHLHFRVQYKCCSELNFHLTKVSARKLNFQCFNVLLWIYFYVD